MKTMFRGGLLHRSQHKLVQRRSYFKASVISGKQVSARVLDALATEVATLWESSHVQPMLAVVQVGSRVDSSVYVGQKMKAAKKIGALGKEIQLAGDISQAELMRELETLNADASVHGIIVQMPLPKHLDSEAVVNAVKFEKDVDGFNIRNVGELGKRAGSPRFLPCTAQGVMELLKSANIDPKGKRAVVIGRSDIVGMPMFQLLQRAGATVTVCHSGTPNVREHTREADIVIAAAGIKEMVGADFIKKGAVVIDVGIHSAGDGSKKLVGDVDFAAVSEVAGAISPVPGGVGPMTVAMLLQNTVRAAQTAADKRHSMRFIALDLKEPVPSDEEICKVTPKRVAELAEEIGVLPAELLQYGPYKGKISLSLLKRLENAPKGKLVVVTGVSPTKFGEGKTTVLLGLVQALNVELGKLTFGTLRQPSQGPTFGVKGGAAGGGYSQVIPMTDVNLHLTGDIHAVTAANNLLCAAVDARVLHEGQQKTDALYRRLVKKGKFAEPQLAYLKKLGISKTDPSTLTGEEKERFARLNIDPATITVKRVLDTNDRFLRDIEIGLGSNEAKYARRTGFDIAVASEVMAILALARDEGDLRNRLHQIVVARSHEGAPITAGDVGCAGAMAALMSEAVLPNLLQSLQGTPILMHAGPFANVAHGQSSVIADEMALRLAGPNGFCVTESGFGADMGFEKFVAIKSRVSHVMPDAAVIVVTLRAMRMHGEALLGGNADSMATLKAGCVNLEQHIKNICSHYGSTVLVALNAFPEDSAEEHKAVTDVALAAGAAACVPTFGWSEGSKGAAKLAQALVDVTSSKKGTTPELKQLYNVEDSIESKIRSLATKIYGAKDISLSDKARREIEWIESQNLGKVPICMAKTPLSFSHDPELKGAPSEYIFPVTDVRLSAGAGFVYPLAGAMQTMPGLSTRPGYFDIDIDEEGVVKGLF